MQISTLHLGSFRSQLRQRTCLERMVGSIPATQLEWHLDTRLNLGVQSDQRPRIPWERVWWWGYSQTKDQGTWGMGSDGSPKCTVFWKNSWGLPTGKSISLEKFGFLKKTEVGMIWAGLRGRYFYPYVGGGKKLDFRIKPIWNQLSDPSLELPPLDLCLTGWPCRFLKRYLTHVGQKNEGK